MHSRVSKVCVAAVGWNFANDCYWFGGVVEQV
jgi:hypothetical protein